MSPLRVVLLLVVLLTLVDVATPPVIEPTALDRRPGADVPRPSSWRGMEMYGEHGDLERVRALLGHQRIDTTQGPNGNRALVSHLSFCVQGRAVRLPKRRRVK